ncbi:MAG: DUF4886 domain-containing protein [Clostridia bacterium]|nr:DUF4886 domain-containing protein [Clostridia bacterium]
MNVLSIGNSFAQDAQRWLHQLAAQHGVELLAVNLYIGGCSLETHHRNWQNSAPLYDLQINGEVTGRKVSIQEALAMNTWDVITLQQVSQDSGRPETYEPYLTTLAEAMRAEQPNVQLYFHQTWAYETDSDHGGFANYDRDQNKMYDAILRTSAWAGERIAAPLLRVGTVVQALRRCVPEFDYAAGGKSLCRDGFHLSLDYGRYAAAAVWLRTLTGVTLKAAAFEDFDTALLEKIHAVVHLTI